MYASVTAFSKCSAMRMQCLRAGSPAGMQPEAAYIRKQHLLSGRHGNGTEGTGSSVVLFISSSLNLYLSRF